MTFDTNIFCECDKCGTIHGKGEAPVDLPIAEPIKQIITMSHEVRPYLGCCRCPERYYPYSVGSDGHFYCEACAVELVKSGLAKHGHHRIKPRKHRCDGIGKN